MASTNWHYKSSGPKATISRDRNQFHRALDEIQAEGRIIAPRRLGLKTEDDVYRYLDENWGCS